MKHCFPLFCTALAMVVPPVAGEIIYDNSLNYEGKFSNTRFEAGDQLELAGTSRLVTEFAFEYFASFTPTGDETARVRIYANDGPAVGDAQATPGSLLYESDSFNITSGYGSVDISKISVLIPADTLIFTVQFSGIDSTEKAGLLNYDQPSVGSSGNFYWQNRDGSWEAVASASTHNNFAARVTAVNAPARLELKTIKLQNGVPQIETVATPGRAYSLQFKESAAEPRWKSTGTAVRATGTRVTLQDSSAASSPLRIYRVAEVNTTIERNGTGLNIIAFAVAGRQYALERTSDFASWTRVRTMTATENTVLFDAAKDSPGGEFFRVIEL